MKKIMKKLAVLVMFVCVVMSAIPTMAFSFGDTASSSINRKGVTSVTKDAYMCVKETVPKAYLLNASPSKYTWTSSNTSVISISGNYICAKKEGKAVVTAKKNKTTYKFTITVKKQFTLATKTFTSIGSVGDFSCKCLNYNQNGTTTTAYSKAKLALNSTFKKNLQAFVKSSGARKSKASYAHITLQSIPSKISLASISNGGSFGWTSKNNCKSTKAVVSLIDTNGDGYADKITIKAYAYGKSGYATLMGSYTAKLTVYNIGSSKN